MKKFSYPQSLCLPACFFAGVKIECRMDRVDIVRADHDLNDRWNARV